MDKVTPTKTAWEILMKYDEPYSIEAMEEYSNQEKESLIKELIGIMNNQIQTADFNERMEEDEKMKSLFIGRSVEAKHLKSILQSKLPPKEKGEENEF